jgi:VRR-NUC domain
MRGCTCTGLTLCAACTALAQRAGVLAPAEPPGISEQAFQDAVIRTAREAGWTFLYHTYRSTRSMGGFPDLIMCHRDASREPGRYPMLAVELKTDAGQVSAAQQAWLEALAGSTGVVAACWRPSQWQEIVTMLRGEGER